MSECVCVLRTSYMCVRSCLDLMYEYTTAGPSPGCGEVAPHAASAKRVGKLGIRLNHRHAWPRHAVPNGFGHPSGHLLILGPSHQSSFLSPPCIRPHAGKTPNSHMPLILFTYQYMAAAASQLHGTSASQSPPFAAAPFSSPCRPSYGYRACRCSRAVADCCQASRLVLLDLNLFVQWYAKQK